MTNWIGIFLIYSMLAIAQLQAGIVNLIKTYPSQDFIATKLRPQSTEIPLAVVMIFQNDAPYLKEWIEYHKMLGVERFYLYNHRSTDGYKDVLDPYVKKGIVKPINWNKKNLDAEDIGTWNATQCQAYMHALMKARADNVKWLAVIDSDEFLVPRQTDSLIDFLQNYEDDNIACLNVNWVMFGTSFASQIPSNKLMIETLLLNKGYNYFGTKNIVRPERCDTLITRGPHNQPLLANYTELTIPFELMQCNHYWSRDEYYLEHVKVPRRIRWGMPPETCIEIANDYNEGTVATDPILRFIPQLRKKMGLDK